MTGLPSIFLAARLVDNEVFSSHARDFGRKEFRMAQVHVIETRVAPGTRDIEVTLIGARLPQSAIKAIEGRLASSGLDHARLLVHQVQPEDHKIDVGSLKLDILADIVRNTRQALQEKETVIATLREQVAQQQAQQQAWVEEAGAATREFEAQYPQCGNVLVGKAVPQQEGNAAAVPVLSAECRPCPDPGTSSAWGNG